MKVRILWFNDTTGKPLSSPTVSLGSGVFSPSATAKRAEGAMGPVAVGAVSKLVIRPDGKSGRAIVVPFVMTSGMISDSDRDGIRVAVSDTSVRVVGNAVQGFDQSYPR